MAFQLRLCKISLTFGNSRFETQMRERARRSRFANSYSWIKIHSPLTDYRQNHIKSRTRVRLRKSVWTVEDQEETFSMEVNVEVFSRPCCPVVPTLGFILAQLGEPC